MEATAQQAVGCAMGVLLPLLVAGAVQSVSHCSWDHPGAGAFHADPAAAVEHYADIPEPVRHRLRQRLARHDYDDVVSIRRDRITGARDYGPDITGMHFAGGRICDQVSRRRWPAEAEERGLVFCDTGYCVLLPTVCGNLARITRRPEPPLEFEPPSAGLRPPIAPTPPAAVPPEVVPPDAPLLPPSELPPLLVTPPAASPPFPMLPPGPYLPPAPFPPDEGAPPPPIPPIVVVPPTVVPPVPPAVPEPPAAWMALLGAVALAAWRRRSPVGKSSGLLND